MTDTAKDESKYIAEGGGAEREGKGQAETTDTLKSNILQRQTGREGNRNIRLRTQMQMRPKLCKPGSVTRTCRCTHIHMNTHTHMHTQLS